MELYPEIHEHFQESCTSTFDVLKIISTQYPTNIVIVRCNEQTQGKGQRDKEWLSPLDGGLYMSAYFPNLNIPLKNMASINWITTLSCAEQLFSLGIKDIQIKWPNDLFTTNGKIGGILSFNQNSNNQIKSTSIGIGINFKAIKIKDRNLGTTSVYEEIQCLDVDLKELSKSITQLIAQKLYLPLVNLNVLYTKWLKYAYGINRSFMVRINEMEETVAKIIAPQKDGSLLIEIDGKQQKIHSGNIKWLYEI